MKSLKRWMLSGLALTLALGLAIGTVNAAEAKKETKKKKEAKKKEEKKKEEKKEEKKASKSSGPSGKVMDGVNMSGRPGFFYGDTANTPGSKNLVGLVGVQFYSLGSQLSIPGGVAYGIGDNIQIHASTAFYSVSGSSGLTSIVAGAKYKIATKNENFNLAVGCDASIGPLNSFPIHAFNLNPYGVGTYTLSNGIQLNGQVGILLPGLNFPVSSTAVVQVNGGLAYPFSNKVTGIVEVAVNGLGSGDTPLIAGLRTGSDNLQFQAYGGLDLATTVGVVVGGGVALVNQ